MNYILGLIIQKGATFVTPFYLLSDLDSNQDKQNQKLLYYPYTIGQTNHL